MAINEMGFNQAATVLNAIVNQATGKANLGATDTASFISLAKIGLETGYDALSTAISQVLSRTIFSVRPYSRKFKGLEADALRYGNHVRKINYADSPFEEDDRIKLTDDYSIDQYTVKKPKAIQTNFYGENVYQRHVTIYRDQLDCAFSGPEEFARFISGVMSNAQDQIEQAHEDMARATLANLIGGVLTINNTPQVVHLITEYNAWSGQSITAATVYDPDIFPAFARWMYGRVATLSKLLRERTILYHQNYTAGDIARHTPLEDQRLYLLGANMDQVSTNVLATTYNDEYLKMIPYEEVMYWQSIKSPDAVKVTAGYTTSAGLADSASVDTTGVMGLLMDREAAGYTVVNEWAQPTPFNARGGYYNQYWHFTDRYWNDFSENAILLMLN